MTGRRFRVLAESRAPLSVRFILNRPGNAMGIISTVATEEEAKALDKEADQRSKTHKCSKCNNSHFVRTMIDNYRSVRQVQPGKWGHCRAYRCMVCGNPLNIVVR